MGNSCHKNLQDLELEAKQEVSLCYTQNFSPSKRSYKYTSPDRVQIREESFRRVQANYKNKTTQYTETKNPAAKQSQTIASLPSTASNSIVLSKLISTKNDLYTQENKHNQSYIYPTPGTHGQQYQKLNLITAYVPQDFEIFQIRVNNIMNLTDFKLNIAKRYETFSDNVVITVGEVIYEGKNDEHKLLITRDLGIDEHTVVKITFKNQLLKKTLERSNKKRSKSNYNHYSSSVVVTTINEGAGERQRGQTQYQNMNTEYNLNSNFQTQNNHIPEWDYQTQNNLMESLSKRIMKLNHSQQSRNFESTKLIKKLEQITSKEQPKFACRLQMAEQMPRSMSIFEQGQNQLLSRNSSAAQLTTVILSNVCQEKSLNHISSLNCNPNIELRTSNLNQNQTQSKKSFMQDEITQSLIKQQRKLQNKCKTKANEVNPGVRFNIQNRMNRLNQQYHVNNLKTQ